MIKKIKRMKNKLNFKLRTHNWKFGDLIKLWISLINQIKCLIENLISLSTYELEISLINEIRDLKV